jgi:hypothetical protein
MTIFSLAVSIPLFFLLPMSPGYTCLARSLGFIIDFSDVL